MSPVTNTERRYGALAVGLHWGMAALITMLVVLGIYMVRLPNAGFDKTKILLILAHKEVGVLVLGLALLRLAWRQFNPLPMVIANVPEWQQVAAIFVHFSLYGLMLVQPIIGWFMSSAAGIPVDVMGVVTLPNLVPHDEDLFATLREVHDWLGFAMAAVVCLHAGAALRHHFVLRDDTLRKMLGTVGNNR